MKLSEFEHHIDARILERGLDYWESGYVLDIHWEDDCIVSKVRGSDLYLVEIKLEESQVNSVYCDCPYDWDDYCKHVVAVLFALKHDGIPKPNRNTANDIIQAMSPDELRALLKEIISKEPQWRERIMARSAKDMDDMFSRYEKLLRERVYTLSDRHGFIGYHQAHDVGRVGDDILSEVETLILDEEFDQAFVICKAVLLAMTEAILQADDSNGYIGGTVHSAIDSFRSIAFAENLPEDMEDTLFAFLTDEDILEQLADLDWHYDLMDIAVEMADTESREKRLFTVAKKMTGSFNGDCSRYGYGWYHQLRLAYLERFATASEAELFIDEHTTIPEFRRMKLEKLHEAGKYDEVIHLARLGGEQDSGLSGLVRDWREWILKGAKGKEDLELQKEVLAQLYDHSYELSYYRELKSLYSPSDWQSVRQKILQNLDGYWRRKADVLIEEGMQNELWQFVSNHISLDVLTKYDRYLLPAYIEEIRNHYKNFIPKFLDLAKGRKHYQRIANLLSHRIDLLGEEFCDNLIRNLLQIYPNRPAMRDEFRQAGFC